MDFIAEVKELATRVEEEHNKHNKGESLNEATTIDRLIRPFIYQLLGYDPREVETEYDAILGASNDRDRVDIAIFIDDSTTIFIECKKLGFSLGKREWNQLRRYFNARKEVRFGVLTNGLRYKFYTDLDDHNIMDEEPFLDFDLLDVREPLVEELQRFSKANFNADTIRSKAEEKAEEAKEKAKKDKEKAEELKYTQKIKDFLAKEYKAPTEEFAKFCMDGISYKKPEGQNITKTDRKKFIGPAKRAFHEFVSEHSAPADTVESNNEPVVPEPSTPPVSDEREWQPLSEFKPQSGDPIPTNILFPDNSQVSIKTWKAILVEIARWLENKKLLDADHCPLLAKDNFKRYIISADPKHSDDTPFKAKEAIGPQPLYIETNAGRSEIADWTRRIIEHVGQDPAHFKVC